MKKSSEIFERIEKKYLLNQWQYEQLRQAVKPYMEVDEYGLSTICNIYYDTENNELIRTSIEKPPYKEKLRLRSYGIPGENDRTFIEIKKKYDGIVYKRRASLPLKVAENYLNHGIKPDKSSQILREIDYFIRHYHLVRNMYIAYDRIAMYGKIDETLRITFDQRIRTRETELNLSKGDYGKLLLANNEILMEIKVSEAYPLWLVKQLSDLKIYPVSFSKYGAAYKQKIQKERGDKICLPA